MVISTSEEELSLGTNLSEGGGPVLLGRETPYDRDHRVVLLVPGQPVQVGADRSPHVPDQDGGYSVQYGCRSQCLVSLGQLGVEVTQVVHLVQCFTSHRQSLRIFGLQTCPPDQMQDSYYPSFIIGESGTSAAQI